MRDALHMPSESQESWPHKSFICSLELGLLRVEGKALLSPWQHMAPTPAAHHIPELTQQGGGSPSWLPGTLSSI